MADQNDIPQSVNTTKPAFNPLSPDVPATPEAPTVKTPPAEPPPPTVPSAKPNLATASFPDDLPPKEQVKPIENNIPAKTPPVAPPLPEIKSAGTPPNNQPPTLPIQKSPFRFLIPILGIGILILLLIFVFQKVFKTKPTSPDASTQVTTITYWGLWEPSLITGEIFAKFEAQNPTIKVNYQQQSIKDYRERLQNALKNGDGPDVFRFHITWTPLLTTDLTPIPASALSTADFEAQQYPVARSWLKSSKGYMGIPLMTDGLGLFYNQSVLEAAGKTVPKTWEELQRLAIELTIPDKKAGANRLLRGGLAMGTTTNVDNWSDIVGWLILQNGSNPVKPDNKLGQDALNFYVSFVKPARVNEQTWDESLPSSTIAFATEKAVMMIAPSWRAFEVKDMNPNLKFSIAPLPQFPEDQVAWASFWVEGVSSHSDKAKQEAAWKLMSYLNQKETLRDFYAAASKERLFGEIFARTDMADQLKSDPYASAFVTQAPYAKTWFLNSRTFDNGPNDKISKYYEDAINGMIAGSTSDKVTPTIEQGVSQIITQYRLPNTVPTIK